MLSQFFSFATTRPAKIALVSLAPRPLSGPSQDLLDAKRSLIAPLRSSSWVTYKLGSASAIHPI